jgi:formate dehydrogenase maturation protein FdhE
MRTNYCPHCGSDKIHKVEEPDGSHYHECEECAETWRHCDTVKVHGLPSWHHQD